MKFIHIADVHLGVKPDRGRRWSEERSEEIWDTFRNIVELCEAQKVDLLLIAGDLFHTPPTLQQIKNVDFQLKKLSMTKTVIIAGNHDYIEDNSSWDTYEFNSDTVVFPRDRGANVYFEDLNVCITGFSYGCAEYKERILEKLKPGREGAYNILLGHGGDATHMPFSKEKLAKSGFDYYALGHIHKPAHIIKNKMAFPGSLEPIDYTETGKRGYILGEVNELRNTRITWVPFNKRSYINMAVDLDTDCTNQMVSEIVETNINKLGKDNIYRILLRGNVESGLDLNLSAISRRYNINEIINNTQDDYDLKELYTVNENNLLGRFIKKMSDKNSAEDEAVRQKALRYGLDALMAPQGNK